MQFENMIPHLVASLSLLEAQVNEWDREMIDSVLLPSEREEFRHVRSLIIEMRKTINLFQLSNAQGATLESYRLLQIFYGLLWMCRPSIQKTMELVNKDSEGRFTSRISADSNNEIYPDKDSAH